MTLHPSALAQTIVAKLDDPNVREDTPIRA